MRSGTAILLAAALAACGQTAQSPAPSVGSARVSVVSNDLYAAVAPPGSTTLRIFNGKDQTWDSSNPTVLDISGSYASGAWTATLESLPVGDYTFCAQVNVDGMSFGPGCGNATVTKNAMASVTLILQQVGNGGAAVNFDSPRIGGISLSDGAPHYGEDVQMSVSVIQNTVRTLAYAWTGTCNAAATTLAFSPPNSAGSTLHTDCKGTVAVTITVSDGSISSSVTFPLTFSPQGANVAVSVNRWPVIAGFTVDQAQLQPGQGTKLGVFVTDDPGETLALHWTATCGSVTADTTDGWNYFTAPNAVGDCTVTVTVTDGLGGMSTASLVLHVVAPVVPAAVVFSNMPPVSHGMPSQAFQAQQTSQFGDLIELAPATGRHAVQATVVLVSWALRANNLSIGTDAGFPFDVTLKIYDPGDLAAPVASRTQTFFIPYRPPEDPNCPVIYGARGFKASDGTCFNRYSFPITFDLAGITLPDRFAYAVAYSTQSYGPNVPGVTGVDGPWNSLNVGVVGDGSTAVSTTPSVGSDPDPTTALRDYVTNGHPAGLVVEPGWTGYAPAAAFYAY